MRSNKTGTAIMLTSSVGLIGLVILSPVLPQISDEFSQVSPTLIRMLVTIPSICSIVMSQISGWLSNFMDKKRLILTGLVLFSFAGIACLFTPSFGFLLAMRILVGLGMGLIVPVNQSLISDYYEGETRARMVSRSMAVNYLGGVAAVFLGGLLAAAGWRRIFLINLYCIAVLAADLFLLPAGSALPDEKKSRQFHILPAPIYGLALGGMAQMIAFYIVVTNAALRVRSIGYPAPILSSAAIALLYFGCFLSGMAMVRIHSILKKAALPCAILLSVPGYVLVFASPVLGLLYLGIFIVGYADGLIIPFIMAKNAELCPVEYSGQGYAAINLGMSLGQFISPVVFALLTGIF